MRPKNVTIREDQAEWVEEAHLNLSSFAGNLTNSSKNARR